MSVNLVMRILKTDYLDKSVEKEYVTKKYCDILLLFAEKPVVKEKRKVFARLLKQAARALGKESGVSFTKDKIHKYPKNSRRGGQTI